MNSCYDDLSRGAHENKMLYWIKYILENYPDGKPLFIVGHYPLFFMKYEEFQENPTTLKLYNLLRSYPQKKIIYLASDVHNHQHIEHENITMLISGTGGADLDALVKPEEKEKKKKEKQNICKKVNEITSTYNCDGRTYDIKRYISTTGYIVITYDGTTGHIFKEILGGQQGGNNYYKSKYIKYVTKCTSILKK